MPAIAVADARAVQEQRVIEHRAVAFRQLRELVHQIRELPEVILVDLVQPFELRRLVLVVRDRVMGVADPDLRI